MLTSLALHLSFVTVSNLIINMPAVRKHLLCSVCVPDSTCKRHLGIAVHALLLDTVLVGFGASSWPLHVAEVLPPPLPTGVFLQPFLFSSSVLKPNLEGKKKKKMRCVIWFWWLMRKSDCFVQCLKFPSEKFGRFGLFFGTFATFAAISHNIKINII